MKTLKQIREEYDNQFLDSVEFLPEEVMLEVAKKSTSLMSTTPSFKQMPSLLVFRRITYRKYPNDQIVALYYSTLVDKYLSIPFGPTGNLNLSEAVVLDEKDMKNPCWKGYKAYGMKKKNGREVPNCVPLEEDGFDLDAVTNAVRSKESRNDYGAKSKSSSASGAYQYINKTWKGSASKYGVDTKQFPTARSAPKDVQDKVFQGDLQKNASKYGSLEKAVNVHYTGNPGGKVSSAGLKANRGQTGGGYMADIKKRVDDYNTERKSTMGAAQQMAANFSGNKTLSTPDSTQFAQAKPTQVASATPKIQNPDQNITKVASAPAPTQVSQLDTKPKQKIAEDWSDVKHQNPSGGLKKSGVMAYRREHPGSNLQTAVTTKPSKLKPGSKAANRRKSFCARMGGMKKRLTSAKTANDPNSRINKSLRKWNCEESFKAKIFEKRQEKMNEGIGDAITGAIGGYMTGGIKGALAGGAKGLFKGGDKKKSKQAEPTTYSTEFGRTRSAKGKTVSLVPTSQGSDPASQSRASSLENKYREKSLQASQHNENKMSDIRKMVKEGIEYKDLNINGRQVTLNTSMAKRILEVYDSVNTKNKKIVEGMLNEDMESFKKLLNFSIKA